MKDNIKTPKMDLSKFAGSIDQVDLELMEQSIAEGCERIETDDWLKQFNSLPDKSFYLMPKLTNPIIPIRKVFWRPHAHIPLKHRQILLFESHRREIR